MEEDWEVPVLIGPTFFNSLVAVYDACDVWHSQFGDGDKELEHDLSLVSVFILAVREQIGNENRDSGELK